MSKLTKILAKIRRKWTKIRLQPIRVFCFHHVSDTFDESTMKRCDWLPTDMFKQLVQQLREEGYSFISLTEAHSKLQHDLFRMGKYAVLTADDGWASLKYILPWLNEQHLPVTLFLNPAYLDGKHIREKETERYVSGAEVEKLQEQYPLLTIGSHGWEHKDATKQTEEEFRESLNRSKAYLSRLQNYIPYFAFTYGRYSLDQLDVVKNYELTSVMVNGTKNYIYKNYIDREILGIDYLRPYM